MNHTTIRLAIIIIAVATLMITGTSTPLWAQSRNATTVSSSHRAAAPSSLLPTIPVPPTVPGILGCTKAPNQPSDPTEMNSVVFFEMAGPYARINHVEKEVFSCVRSFIAVFPNGTKIPVTTNFFNDISIYTRLIDDFPISAAPSPPWRIEFQQVTCIRNSNGFTIVRADCTLTTPPALSLQDFSALTACQEQSPTSPIKMNTVTVPSDEKVITAEKHVYLCKSPSSLQAPPDKIEDVISFTILDQPPVGLTPIPTAPSILDRYWSIVCVKSITSASVDGCGIALAPPGQFPNPTPAPTVTPTQRR